MVGLFLTFNFIGVPYFSKKAFSLQISGNFFNLQTFCQLSRNQFAEEPSAFQSFSGYKFSHMPFIYSMDFFDYLQIHSIRVKYSNKFPLYVEYHNYLVF